MEKEIAISATHLAIGYPRMKHKEKNCLFDNLSFNLYKGELVCLLGSNGAGKSTLLRTMSNAQQALSGSIQINSKDINSYNEKEIAKLLGIVLTDRTSTGGLTVRELVELGRYPYTGFFGRLDETDRKIVEKAMSDVCIIHKAESYMAELSDGERQKVMIAKVLAQECPIILLDEPTAFLDISSRIEIIKLLHDLAAIHNKTILLSTHDIELALLLADRLWLLSQESGLQSGITEDVILSGKLDNFFGDSIMFNKNTGSYLPKLNPSKAVYLETDKEITYHWVKNMLLRNGIQISDYKSNTNVKLYVSYPTSFILEIDSNKNILSNLEEVLFKITHL